MAKKIAWVVNSPISIYSNFFEELGKKYPDLDPVMISPSSGLFKNYQHFRTIFLPAKNLAKWLFFYRYLGDIFFRRRTYKSKVKSLYYKGLKETLEKENPDVVMSTLYFVPSTWQVYRYCRKTGTPFILWVKRRRTHQGIWEAFLNKISFVVHKRIFKKADLILGFTEASAEFVAGNLPESYSSKIRSLPIASVDTNKFYPLQKEKDNSVLKIIVPARYVPMKWHEGVIKAASHLKQNYDPAFRITLLGNGPLKQQLQQQAENLGVEDRIRWEEKVPHAQMNEVFNEHDIMLLASSSEPIGRVVAEAMATGLPVVVSDQVGAKTYVKPGENGYIFRNLDHKDMADKINLLREEEHRRTLGENARKDMENNFSFDRLTGIFKEYIDDLIIKRP